MKKIISASLIIILAAIGFTPVLASDTSDALYNGIIQVSNNSTATTNVATVFTGNATAWVDLGYMYSTGNNTAIVTASGSDIRYMPNHGTNPWCLWVDTINANTHLTDILYMGGETDMQGEIAYFPDTAGMSVADAAALEPSADYSVSISGWIDTTAASENIVRKGDDFYITIGEPSGNITAYAGLSGNITPTSHTDSGGTWADDALAYDEDTVTMATETLGAGATGNFLEFNHAGVYINAINYHTDIQSKTAGDWLDLDIYHDGAWHHLYQDNPANNVWSRAYLGAFQYVTSVRARFYNDVGAGNVMRIKEMQFLAIGRPVTATGVTSGEHDITVSANTSHMTMTVDGVLEDTIALSGSTIADNSDNWIFAYPVAMPYMETANLTISGTLQGSWEWELGATFTDLSGNGHTATPSFRSASSDPDVSAALLSFKPITEADPPAYTLSSAPDVITTTPEVTGGFTTDVSPTYPASDVIAAIAIAGQVPTQLPTILIATFIIIVLSLSMSSVMRRYGSGALVIKAAVIMLLMAISVAVSVYDVYQVYFFGIMALGIMWMSRQREAY